jgi:hypothetical protein
MGEALDLRIPFPPCVFHGGKGQGWEVDAVGASYKIIRIDPGKILTFIPIQVIIPQSEWLYKYLTIAR